MSVNSVEAIASLPAPSNGTSGAIGTNAFSRPASFASMLLDGADKVNSQLIQADAKVRAFALDDSVPVHEVTFALEQARMSVELMMQVRTRLLEGYQQLMNMQL
jgi:flagellar hook-basal body complex protein FliE